MLAQHHGILILVAFFLKKNYFEKEKDTQKHNHEVEYINDTLGMLCTRDDSTTKKEQVSI